MGWIELGVELEGANVCGHGSNVAYDPCTNGPQSSGVSTNVVRMWVGLRWNLNTTSGPQSTTGMSSASA